VVHGLKVAGYLHWLGKRKLDLLFFSFIGNVAELLIDSSC